jgi:hypothetical protein
MSDLQLGLLAIGVAVVAGVIAYNRWQEARLRRRTEGAFASRHDDALLRGGGAAAEAAAPVRAPVAEPAQVDRTIEHTIVVDGLPAPAQPPPEVPAAPLAATGLDPAVDYIVELECARPVAGADLARHAQALLDEGLVRPVHWEG